MALSEGATIGSYRVTAKIGEGGMGEVYRARDTKLDRDAAFTDQLAYIRHRDDETVLMIPLDDIGVEEREILMIDSPGGDAPPGRRATRRGWRPYCRYLSHLQPRPVP